MNKVKGELTPFEAPGLGRSASPLLPYGDGSSSPLVLVVARGKVSYKIYAGYADGEPSHPRMIIGGKRVTYTKVEGSFPSGWTVRSPAFVEA